MLDPSTNGTSATGAPAEGRSVVHAYDEEGLYRVKLLARCEGCSQAGTAIDEILVRVGTTTSRCRTFRKRPREPNEEIPVSSILVN